MIRTHYDDQYEYFLDYFQGMPVKILRDRQTGQLFFAAESVARVLGYESTQDMMSQDEVLDLINQHKQQRGESPLRQC